MSTKMLVSRSNLTAIGAAIRSKNKSTDTYLPSEMGPAIEALEDPSVLTTKQVTENGTYDAADDEADGYSVMTVNVPNSYAAADEGKVVSSGALVSQTSVTKTANGTYDTTLNNQVVVNVPAANLGTKTITQNGTYSAADDEADGYSEVTVNVSGGGGGTPTISRADWNALTTAQKQAYGLVGIIDYTTGFNRGVLVNGADYAIVNGYLPQTNEALVKTFATYDRFEAGSTEWGDGDSPITASKALTRYQSEDAVYFDAKTNSNAIGVPLGGKNTDFTMYVVAKGLSYVSGDVIVMGSVYSWSKLNEIMLYHRSGTVWRSSVYGSDEDLIDTQGGYVAVAIRSASMKASWFSHDGARRTSVSYNNHGTSFTFGSYGTTFSTDLAVKFVGYVAGAETDAQIAANLANLATVFGLS